jgi:hypothetical protein
MYVSEEKPTKNESGSTPLALSSMDANPAGEGGILFFKPPTATFPDPATSCGASPTRLRQFL